MNDEERLLGLELTSLKTERIKGDIIVNFNILHSYDDVSIDHFFHNKNSYLWRDTVMALRVSKTRLNLMETQFLSMSIFTMEQNSGGGRQVSQHFQEQK